jgi:hypothetical protein
MLFLCTRRPATGGALRHETAESGLVMRGRLPPPRAKIEPWGLQGSPTGGRTTVSGVRLFSRLVICLCGHGLVQGLERVEHSMRVRRLFHRRRLGGVPVGDLGQIAAPCFEQGDAFSGFLLGQQAHLQGQLGPLFRQRALADSLNL